MTDRGAEARSQERVWRPGRPCPVGQVLGAVRRGPGDPTYRVDAAGAHWRATRTPAGPATLRVAAYPREGTVVGTAWGPGATWVLDQLPAMLGEEDDWTGFSAGHPVVAEARRRNPHWRIGRTGLVMESLVPAIIEQKVTGQEAFLGFRRLVRGFGEAAPGPEPGPGLDLWLQPAPRDLTGIASWEWLRMRIDPARSRALVTAARVADALERTTGLAHPDADARLRSLPGIGVWTSAETRVRAHGDPDAVSFGDYHVAADIGWALTGEPVDDAGLAELLEPWAGHRYRVQGLLGLAGLHRPRRGPRMSPRTHLPG